MSGRHRRPLPDALPDVDLAEEVAAAPVVAVQLGEASPLGEASEAGAAPATPGPTVMARRNRAAERAARKRAARRRVLVASGVVLVLLVAGAGAWLLQRGGDGTGPTVATSSPRQLTTLVQVEGVDGAAAASALIGTTEADGDAVAVLVPSRLLVDVVGAGEMPFGEVVTLDQPAASAGALTDLVGVSVKDSWVLTPAGLAALVDSVGGVQAAVDVDVLAPDGKTVVVPAGNQRLKGAAAAAYATYLADGEPEQARLARFDDVLTAVAAALPKDTAGIVTTLTKLGAGSRSTLDSTALAARLLVLHSAAAKASLVSDVLPVSEIDTGGTTTTFGLNAADAAAMMRSRFPGALLQDAAGQVVRVLVENGVGKPGLTDKARTKLVDAGFRFVNGGNASPFNNDPSQVLVGDGTAKSIARGKRVAAALGLPGSSVSPSDRGQTVADVIVILGSDFAG